MIALVGIAEAASSSASFATDAGGWDGGAVADGVLSATDSDISLSLGAVDELHAQLRVRLASGERLTVTVGGVELTATYSAGGALDLAGLEAPLPLAEQAWTADTDALSGGHPSLAYLAGTWFLAHEEDGTVSLAAASDRISSTRGSPRSPVNIRSCWRETSSRSTTSPTATSISRRRPTE